MSTVKICDLCKNPKYDFNIPYVVKKKWWIFLDGGSGFDKLDICTDCWDNFVRYANEKRGDKDETG